MNPWEEILAHATQARVKDEHDLMEMIAADKLERLEAENARLREVVQFYADPKNYTAGPDNRLGEDFTPVEYDAGKRARVALEGME